MVIYQPYMRQLAPQNYNDVIMAPRLDAPTLFDRAHPYRVTLHVEAREAVLSRDLGPCDRSKKSGEEADEERSRRNSVARSKARIRILAKANKLCRLMTLTFAEAHHDRTAVLAKLALFERKIHALWPKLCYVYVLEKHPGGHGYHVHLGLSRFVPKVAMAEVWGHGFVDLRRIKSNRAGASQGAADVSRYLAKYLDKTMADVPKGQRRFSGSHNLVDTEIHASFEHWADADAWIRMSFKPQWEEFLDDKTCEGWRGPPCWLYR